MQRLGKLGPRRFPGIVSLLTVRVAQLPHGRHSEITQHAMFSTVNA
jgi:hypothetical protein